MTLSAFAARASRCRITTAPGTRLVLLVSARDSFRSLRIGPDSDGELPNLVVAEKLLKITGASRDLLKFVADRPGHDRRYAVDSTKLRKLTGWAPKISFEDGLLATVNWYRNNATWIEQVKSGEYLKFFDQNYQHRGL